MKEVLNFRIQRSSSFHAAAITISIEEAELKTTAPIIELFSQTDKTRVPYQKGCQLKNKKKHRTNASATKFTSFLQFLV